MSLKKCIKATANLDDADTASVLESFDSYKDSMESNEAARLAIDDVIASLGQERQEYIQLFNETYPDALKEAGQKPDLTPLPKPKPTPKPAEKLEDVGEKIGGARKDVWSGFRESIDTEISDEEILRLPLSKLYPEPNYQKLAEQGADPLALATIKVMRDEIPPKGKRGYKQRRYIEQVKVFQNVAAAVLDNTLSAKRVVDKMREAGILKNLADRIDLMLELGFPAKPANLKGIKFAEVHFSLYKGEKDVNKWIVDITSKSRKSLGGMGGTIAATNTREEAVTALRNYLEAEAAKPKPKKGATKFEIYRYRSAAQYKRGWIVGKKIGRNYYDMKEGFENQTKAREYVTENQDKLEEQLKKHKEIPAHRKPVNEARLGEDYRGGKDVTADEFRDTFGFRGVEFGNWVEQGKRQQDVNEAYDGLMDLAKLLNIPPKAISLNGELAMAFGARGAGGIDPAKAHYEPGKVVINLTKKTGAGSLAHEWFHGLDNYFSRMRGDAQSYITDRPFPLTNKAVRQEMLDRFKDIVTAVKATGLPKRAAVLDGKKAKDYWGTTIEMQARTFESYIINKLKDAGISNDYLANIVSPEYWKAAEALGLESESSYPYVLEEEMKPVTEAYDALFESIKTKETEQGTALYSKRPANIDTRGNPLVEGDFVQRDEPILVQPKRNVSAESLTKLVNNIQINNPGTRGLTFYIRATQAEAFGVNSVAENGLIKGGFYSGTNEIVLIAENIKDINDAMSVIRHEAVGHYGLRQLLNKEGKYDKLLDRVYEARSDELKAQYDWVAKAYPELVAQNDVRKIADEMLAHAAETETKTKSNLLTKIYDAIIKLLNKLGLVLDTVSHKEVNALIRLSEANLRKNIRPQVYQQGAAYRAEDVAPDMFYSQLENQLAEKLPKSGTPKQFKDTIAAFARKGQIKAEELEWSGVNEWLDEQTGKVSKNDVIDFIRANRIKVDEVEKRDDYQLKPLSAEETKEVEMLEEKLGPRDNVDNLTTEEFFRYRELNARDKIQSDTKFAQYVLPGGEKYRELLLTLPREIEPAELSSAEEGEFQDLLVSADNLGYDFPSLAREAIRGHKDWAARWDVENIPRLVELGNKYRDNINYRISGDVYKGGHYDEPNILAHIRFNERTDADGKRVLFVEEIQSDWHQAGRKKGYVSKAVTDEFARLDGEVKAQAEKITDFKGERLYSNKEFQKIVDARDVAIEKRDNFKKEKNLQRTAAGGFYGVPDAPFKTTWPLLAMKRVIRHAAENNFDRIAWTTGEQQAARYDLSKQLDRVEYWGPMEDGKYGFSAFKVGNEGAPDIKENWLEENQLEDFLGKDVAKKIIAHEGATEKVGDTQYGELKGLDLKVGGEGMKGFYDNILPKTVNKYVKKWGGKVSKTAVTVQEYTKPKTERYTYTQESRNNEIIFVVIDYEGSVERVLSDEAQARSVVRNLNKKQGALVEAGAEVHSLNITDKMRTAAMEGQPLFAKKARIGNGKYEIDVPTKDEITQVILDHPLVKFTGKVKNAYIIGSFAKGKANEMSDVDVLFEVNKRKGYTEQQLIEKYRRGLQQYFVENKIMGRRDDLHPQWNGRRVDIYFTYDASKETRPKVKLPESHAETFDANDPNVMFSRAADDTNDAPTDGNLGMPEESLKQFTARMLHDSFNRVKALQETIIERGGEVKTEADVYRAEERSSSKISYRLKKLGKESLDPMLKLMKQKGITIDVLDNFLMAHHAQERNEYIAGINEKMPDGGSGITNQEAADYLDSVADQRSDLEEIAKFVYKVNDQALTSLVEAGHMKKEEADIYRDRWDYYVPLKGKEGEEIGFGTGAGFAISGTGIKSAMGRGAGNIAESPTAHSFAQAETVIVRTEKSKVGQALVELVRANPDPGFWGISQRTYQQFENLFGEPFEGYSEAPEGLIEDIDYHRVMAITAEERVQAKAEGRKPTPKVVYQLDQNYKRRDDIFTVMVKGEELLIQIKDQVLMEQLKKMNTTQLNAVLRGFGSLNRYLAMVNTALNPEFVITNLERDFQTAMVNLGGEHSAAAAAKVAKAMPAAMRGIWQSTFDTKGTSEWRTLYDEMQEEGGAIGFFGLEDIETKVRNIQSKLKDRHGVLGQTKRGILGVRDIILDANLSVENAARLGAYKVIKEESIANGMSEKDAKAKAASVAKNLTVNFNRKGELAPVLNSAYLFYNASIQGSMRILTALKNKRVRKIVSGVAVTAFAQAMYNMEAGGDDDDGIPYWDKISDYTKQTSMIFMHPDGSGEYTKVRLPYGYNVFHYAGTAMHDLMYGKDSSVAKTTMNMLSAVMNAYNPIQGADLLDTLTPTFFKPFEQDARNINFMGANLKPEYPFDTYDRPESQKYFKSTNPQLVEMMQTINELTGGDETHSGLIDMSPQIVKHYIGWATGGAGMFGTRALSTISDIVTGEEIEQKGVPFLRTLGGKPGAHYDANRFYEAVKEVAAVEAQLKLYKGTDRWSEYKQDNAEIHGLALHVKRYKNKIKRLREQRDKAYLDDDRDLAKEKTEKIRLKMMEFSIKYDEAIEAQE